MPRYFTHYWTNDTWENARRLSAPGATLEHTAGNRFVERGVASGDFVYVVTEILHLSNDLKRARNMCLHERHEYHDPRPQASL